MAKKYPRSSGYYRKDIREKRLKAKIELSEEEVDEMLAEIKRVLNE